MKKLFLLLVLSLLFPLVLSACSSGLTLPEEEKETIATETEAEKADPKTKEAKEESSAIFDEDPAEDGEMNILMIGNSYCYYYVEELYGIAKAAGMDWNIYNLYYSGCPLDKHWNWYLERESQYQLYCTDKGGRQKLSDGIDLISTLRKANWDVVSLQTGNGSYRRGGIEGLRGEVEPYLGKLLNALRQHLPDAKFYWHCAWVPEAGDDREVMGEKYLTKEQEIAWQNARITVAEEIREKHGLPIIPTGAAWLEARYQPLIGNTLCKRLANLNDKGHDGDIGGGQYLNACVWFETLTGQSCIGNTWRPDYELSEQKIALLQEAAHKTVAAQKG